MSGLFLERHLDVGTNPRERRARLHAVQVSLSQFAESDDLHPVHRVLRSHPIPAEPHGDDTLTRGARDKTSARRLSKIRKELTPGARLLEIGVRDGSFGVAASREFEY